MESEKIELEDALKEATEAGKESEREVRGCSRHSRHLRSTVFFVAYTCIKYWQNTTCISERYKNMGGLR